MSIWNSKAKKILKREVNGIKDVEFVDISRTKNGHFSVEYNFKKNRMKLTASGSPSNKNVNISVKMIVRDINRRNNGQF